MPDTALHSAVKDKKQIADIDALFTSDSKLELDALNDDGKTALTLAVETKQYDTAMYLCRKKASLITAFPPALQKDGKPDILFNLIQPWMSWFMQQIIAAKEDKFKLLQEFFNLCNAIKDCLLKLSDGKKDFLRFFNFVIKNYAKEMKPDFHNDVEAIQYLENHSALLSFVMEFNKECDYLDAKHLKRILESHFLADFASLAYQKDSYLTKPYEFYEFCYHYYWENDAAFGTVDDTENTIEQSACDLRIRALDKIIAIYMQNPASTSDKEEKRDKQTVNKLIRHEADIYFRRAELFRLKRKYQEAANDCTTAIKVLKKLPQHEAQDNAKIEYYKAHIFLYHGLFAYHKQQWPTAMERLTAGLKAQNFDHPILTYLTKLVGEKAEQSFDLACYFYFTAVALNKTVEARPSSKQALEKEAGEKLKASHSEFINAILSAHEHIAKVKLGDKKSAAEQRLYRDRAWALITYINKYGIILKSEKKQQLLFLYQTLSFSILANLITYLDVQNISNIRLRNRYTDKLSDIYGDLNELFTNQPKEKFQTHILNLMKIMVETLSGDNPYLATNSVFIAEFDQLLAELHKELPQLLDPAINIICLQLHVAASTVRDLQKTYAHQLFNTRSEALLTECNTLLKFFDPPKPKTDEQGDEKLSLLGKDFNIVEMMSKARTLFEIINSKQGQAVTDEFSQYAQRFIEWNESLSNFCKAVAKAANYQPKNHEALVTNMHRMNLNPAASPPPPNAGVQPDSKHGSPAPNP